MKSKKYIITNLVDNNDSLSDKQLSEDVSKTVIDHKKIVKSLQEAYSFLPSDSRLNFLSERVIAEANSEKDFSAIKRVRFFCRNIFKGNVLAWSSVVSIIFIIAFAGSFAFLRQHKAEPQQLESFVIFQTQDGDGVIRYFNYKKVKNNENI